MPTTKVTISYMRLNKLVNIRFDKRDYFRPITTNIYPLLAALNNTGFTVRGEVTMKTVTSIRYER